MLSNFQNDCFVPQVYPFIGLSKKSGFEGLLKRWVRNRHERERCSCDCRVVSIVSKVKIPLAVSAVCIHSRCSLKKEVAVPRWLRELNFFVIIVCSMFAQFFARKSFSLSCVVSLFIPFLSVLPSLSHRHTKNSNRNNDPFLLPNNYHRLQ